MSVYLSSSCISHAQSAESLLIPGIRSFSNETRPVQILRGLGSLRESFGQVSFVASRTLPIPMPTRLDVNFRALSQSIAIQASNDPGTSLRAQHAVDICSCLGSSVSRLASNATSVKRSILGREREEGRESEL